jgi:hypothetical protein
VNDRFVLILEADVVLSIDDMKAARGAPKAA